jgi:hypothetical protein
MRSAGRRIDQGYGLVTGLEPIVFIGGPRWRGWLQLGLGAAFGSRPERRGSGHLPGNAVTVSANHQFIVLIQLAFDHAHTVDADAVGTAEIAHNQEIRNLSNTAVPPGDLPRIDLDIALRVSANQQDRLIDQDTWSVREGYELCRHGAAHRLSLLRW